METIQKIKRDVYAIVTDRIIEQLEKGTVPWRKPWSGGVVPQNLVTGRPYRGINLWLLSMLGYESNYFLTFKQAKDLGASVRKGEKALPVVFWKWKEVEDEKTGEVKKIPFIRYYLVFNIAQCKGLPDDIIPALPENTIDPLEECEMIIRDMPKKPGFKHEGPIAAYDPVTDTVMMPNRSRFENSESYYETFFHELVHSTGHESRLNRKELIKRATFDSEPYSLEELTAEMGACYLIFYAGFGETNFENNAAYIGGWLKRLQDNKKFIIRASTKAQRTVDFILNLKDASVRSANEEEKAIEEVTTKKEVSHEN